MSEPLKLLGICGSLRRDSWNRKLLQEAARHFGPAQYSEADLRVPLFDEDLEAAGLPDSVLTLKAQVADADAVIIACPEYNKAPPGVLKNAFDWLSRGSKPWINKPVAIMSAAAGRAGGERAQFALRLMMVPYRADVLVWPEILLASPKDHFNDQGQIITESYTDALADLMAQLRKRAEGTGRLLG
jgi:chromate reductase